jgi:hypothetical protein
MCRCGGTGRRAGLKIRWGQPRVGSIPTTGTIFFPPPCTGPLFLLILKAMRPRMNKRTLILVFFFAVLPIFSILLSCSKKVSGISGGVLDGGGQPIPNVKVIALQEKPVSGYAKFETTTGSDGRFSIPGCYPESNYKLLLHAEGTDLREVLVKTGAAGTETVLPSPVVFRFLSSPEGVITDTKTGLQWAVDSGKTMTWEQAKRYIKGLRLGGFDDWLMPKRDELKTLGKIDADFPLPECCVWSSEPKDGRRAWAVDLYRSVEDIAFMSNNSYAALAVRRPQ